MRVASSLLLLLSSLLLLLCCVSSPAPARAAERFEWQTATPESQGMSSAQLDAMKDDLAARKTAAFLVIRHDRIVYEWYANGQTAASKQGTASLAKAIVGGMSLAVAISDGLISLDDKAAKYVPQWTNDPLKSQLTVRHLGSHTSGLDDAEADHLPHENLTGWKGDFWKRLDPPHDPFTIARDTDPMLFAPGERLQYSNPGIAMLTWTVTAAIKDSPQTDIRSLLSERIMRSIGARDAEWSVGYGRTFTVDGLPLVASWGGGSFTPRTVAQIGRLVLREGDWDGTQLLAPESIRLVTQDAGLPGHCGMGWWTNAAGRYSTLPRDAVWGAGAGHQILLVVPSLQLILVRNGEKLTVPNEDPNADDAYDPAVDQLLFEPLMTAFTDNPQRAAEPAPSAQSAPYPPSPVISGIEWAPPEEIARAAPGSDNWPLTWADDDQQYTAYGDGRGFEPFVPRKLSLGLAAISGGPADFRGVNIPAPDVEATGDDVRGRKASGMLCVDGVLYLLARNADNSQLAWSGDHGRTWTWADWKFTTSFGCPTFLNFGRNYAGARDEFVYVYSLDAGSAYEAADRMVLARVAQDRLRDPQAYEFLQRIDDAGRPIWTSDIDQRGAVFEHRGRCYRSGVTYNPGLKRYLWCQVFPESHHPGGPRFQGGCGVFDAPEPWGPWSTAYFTDDWDVGPGDTNSFPTKWMSDDGRTMHLVFSGDDCFSVRRARLMTEH